MTPCHSTIEKRDAVLFFVGFTVLFFLFRFDLFHLVDTTWFSAFQNDSDANVLGRIAMSREHGLWSSGGLLGHYKLYNYSFDDILFLASDKTADNWHLYTAQMGLQGWIYSWIDTWRAVDWNALGFFQTFASFTNAFALGLLLVWFQRSMGAWAAWAVLAGIPLSPWLLVFGHSVNHALWTLYLPLLVVAWTLEGKRGDLAKDKCFLALVFAAFFIRSASGNEFYTTVVFASFAPVVFYAIRDQWPLRKVMFSLLSIGVCSCAAIVLTSVVCMAQIKSAMNSDWLTALGCYFFHVTERLSIHTSVVIPQPEDVRGINCPVWKVVGYYFKSLINDFSVQEPVEVLWERPLSYFRPTFGAATFVAVILSLPLFFARLWPKNLLLYRRTGLATAGAMATGMVGVLSWFVLVKQHSYVHTHINFFLFYVPFGLFFMAYIGQLAHGLGQGVCAIMAEFARRSRTRS